ncbi:TetR/AcrR family transcriptional regulator [Solicola gregarius]|uniref:TetR/AcrR family transcriptional regulator n=1 Tax=Solicola gregarius TaxID=2908642 RepID=A0AA46TG54_9ACTN|nr:TetR/AcrR family transcriptional regulator [Solicola gregarius]UYM03953.1 TetR/AcrR family transcriptional regulator [Solicola gregarius]
MAPTTRARLVETTRTLLWERGYAATSPGAILTESGVGQGSMYHHFAGKEDLAAEALDESAAQLVAAADRILNTGAPATDRLITYLTRQRDVMRGCPVGRMTGDPDVLDSDRLHRIVRETFDHVRTTMSAVVRAGIDDGEFAPDTDPDALADTILAIVQGGYVLARAAGTDAPFGRAIDGAAALLAAARLETSR